MVLAGNLHDHSTDSDGDTASSKVARWFKANHDQLGLDFETLTDHSDFFPLAPLGPVTNPVWARQGKLANQLTGDGFTVMRGFEWTNDQQNHLNVIGSQNWTSRLTTGDAALSMEPFWTWLSTKPVRDPTGAGLGVGGADGLGQFNHPSEKGVLNWDDYKLHAGAAKAMATIEVIGNRAKNAHDLMNSDAGWYWYALSKGWNVSPVMNFDFHDWQGDGVIANAHPGRDCGLKGYLTCQRTLVLARANTPDAIRDAIRMRRTSASEMPDLWATLRGGADNAWQGSTIKAAPGSTITLTVDAGSASQPLQSVDIVSDASLDPHPYYDGDNVPCSVAHCKPTAFVHGQFVPSLIKQHARYVATGGYATKKVRHDAAPPPALVATVALSGNRATKTITVRVPSTKSNRPDGKHFFYAVAHAAAPPGATGPGVTARAWTGPLFTTGVPVGTWIAGDTHVHDDHSSDGSSVRQGIDQGARGNVSVADQIHQAERVGLGFLPLTDHRTYDQQWDPLWTSNKLILIPGEEANGSPHANVHGAADELVDGANPPGSAEYRHFQQSIWDVHAQNASWQTNHPDDGEWNGTKPNANASAVGVDTVESWNRGSDPDGELDYAENRLNAGYRFGLTGASDNHFKELWGVAGPGMPTTYVFAPTPTERGVVAGLRAGHTSVSVNPLGPMVTLTADVDGDGAYESMGGDEVTAVTGAAATLKVRVRRAAGMTVFVYAAPGRSRGPVATFSPTKLDQSFTLALAPTASWYRVEVRGIAAPPGLAVDTYRPNNALLAFASPLFVDQMGRAAPRAESPLPPLTTATDGAVAAIETPGAFAGFGDVAATPSAAHVVAEVDVGGRASVTYRRMSADASSALGDPERLSDLDASARFPSVAAVGNDVWVAWQEERGQQTPHRTNIVVRHSNDGGRSWDKPRNVTTTNHAQHPTIEVTRDNRAVAAWADNARGAFDVYVQELFVGANAVNVSAPGKHVRAGLPTDTRSAVYPASLFPSLTVAADGRVAVAWTDNRRDIDPGWTGSRAGEGTAPDDWEIFTAARPRGGTWGAPVNASNDSKRADRHPSIAFTGNEQGLVVAWDSKELKESGVNLDVRYSQAPPTGAGWQPARQIGFNADAMSQRPQVVTAGTGARVVWYDSRSADWRWSLWSAAVDPSGAAPVRLTGAGNASYAAASGNLVAFTSDRHATRVQRDQTQGVYLLRH
jgi:predicted metal-dependent phosphoesterase TrpH